MDKIEINARRMRESDPFARTSSSLESESVISPKNLDSVIGKLTKESFKGLVCLFNLEGKILYANDRFCFLSGAEEGPDRAFFHYIAPRERQDVLRMFVEVHKRREVVKTIECSLPLVVGRYEIKKEHIIGELRPLSFGFVLKIPDEVLVKIKEMELERLKLLLLKHPSRGLWITDEKGVIVDILKTNCEAKLGWEEGEIIGRNISSFTSRDEPETLSEDTYLLSRVHKNGALLRTRAVRGKVRFSDGCDYWVYLDTYL